MFSTQVAYARHVSPRHNASFLWPWQREAIAAANAVDRDLYAFALPRLPEIQLPHDVHFHDEGSSVLAESVEAAIRAALARAEAAPKL